VTRCWDPYAEPLITAWWQPQHRPDHSRRLAFRDPGFAACMVAALLLAWVVGAGRRSSPRPGDCQRPCPRSRGRWPAQCRCCASFFGLNGSAPGFFDRPRQAVCWWRIAGARSPLDQCSVARKACLGDDQLELSGARFYDSTRSGKPELSVMSPYSQLLSRVLIAGWMERQLPLLPTDPQASLAQAWPTVLIDANCRTGGRFPLRHYRSNLSRSAWH